MIRSLRIENFALIESAEIQFQSGFTVITGETGSGKSILLNALNLILGERANFGVIGESKDKSVVETEIDISRFGLESFFKNNELDYFETAIVRREIYKQGRSRAFINDVPVQLTTLKEFSSKLIHIHSQYNTLELKDKEYQLLLLDVLSGALEKRHQFNKRYKSWSEAKRRLSELEELLSAEEQKQDYNSFQLEEINALDLDNNDYDAIQDELNMIENADDLREAYGMVVQMINDDTGAVSTLQSLASSLSKTASIDPAVSEFHQRLTSVIIELKDLASEAEDNLEKVELDPEKLQELAVLMDGYNKILAKHRVQSQDELKQIRDELSEATENLDSLRQELTALEKTISVETNELEDLALELHDIRVSEAPKIAVSIQNSLDALKLKDTVLDFNLGTSDTLGPFGKTTVEILFSPNKGLAPVPIHTAASGGELSRVMLALQNHMSRKTQLQTILFDEIDTGVSGDVAQKIGILLREMGEGMQVIAITHLPQVAAKGGQHLSVYKEVVNGVTKTFIKELSDEERLIETARLMSGDQVNEAALENARSLMS